MQKFVVFVQDSGPNRCLGQIIGGYFRNGRLNKKYEKKLKG